MKLLSLLEGAFTQEADSGPLFPGFLIPRGHHSIGDCKIQNPARNMIIAPYKLTGKVRVLKKGTINKASNTREVGVRAAAYGIII
jgi:hypothetical protein